MIPEIEFIFTRLKNEATKTLSFFGALREADWHKKLYADGAQWDVRQVFAHLVATEKGILQLLENILAGKGGVPQEFNLNVYNERKVDELAIASPQELLNLFEQRRGQVIELVNTLRAEDLDQQGRHPFLGMASVRQILKLLYRHDQMHQSDIQKALEQS